MDKERGSMKNKIKVGDIIEIQDAWEDTSGAYHDEFPEVLAIDDDGDMKLKFDRKDITKFLESAEFNVKDYQNDIVDQP